MDSHRRHLHRGFNWLGGAAAIAKVIDMATLLAVLLFLSKQQVGVASLVISVGTIVESLDGLGSREALVQAPALSRAQLDTLFWFIAGAALIVAALMLVAAPYLEALYGVAGMAVYFVAVAAKQPIVGAAVIPLAMMSRDLQYERIAVVNVSATLGAALTRLGLAVAGAGVWSLVGGYFASGLYTLIAAQLARPFWPRLHFRMGEIAPLVRFGVHAATSNFLDQWLRNVDYLLIGWFYGPARLAVYRVAFAIGMEPALAVGTLINRTVLPVFVRASAVKGELAQSLMWSLRRLALLIAPLAAATILAAGPITALIHDAQGHSYAAAALPLELLAGAALLRVTSQLLYPLVMGSGRPEIAARLSLVTLLLLVAGFILVGMRFPARTGIAAASAVWVALYPLLLVWEGRYLRRHWNIGARELARAFRAPLIGAAVLACALAVVRLLARGADPGIQPGMQLGIVAVAAAITYAVLSLHARERRAADDTQS
ncbi:MAG: oligosaccharide flippase family protein [Steroidobacteraceae bacterium]